MSGTEGTGLSCMSLGNTVLRRLRDFPLHLCASLPTTLFLPMSFLWKTQFLGSPGMLISARRENFTENEIRKNREKCGAMVLYFGYLGIMRHPSKLIGGGPA